MRYALRQRIFPDLQFKMIETALFHASVLKALEQFFQVTNVYGYRMNYVPAIWGDLRGAYHCAELPFFIGTIRDIKDTPATELNLKQAEVLQDDWTFFMKNGSLPR